MPESHFRRPEDEGRRTGQGPLAPSEGLIPSRGLQFASHWIDVLLPVLSRDVWPFIGRGSWLKTADIASYYRQLSRRMSDLPFFAFEWQGVVYLDLRTDFGGTTSPGWATTLSLAISLLGRIAGHTVTAYYDDFLFVAPTPEETEAAYAWWQATLRLLGMVEAVEKASETTQVLTFLGPEIDSRLLRVGLSEERLANTVAFLSRIRNSKAISIQLRTLQRLTGLLNWISMIIPSVKGSFFRFLSVQNSPELANSNRVTLSEWFLEELLLIEYCLLSFNGSSSFAPRPPLAFMPAGDACCSTRLQGIGLFWQGEARFFDATDFGSDWQIAELESLAILFSLICFGTRWSDRAVEMLCDSQNAQDAFRRGFSGGSVIGRRLSSLVRAARVTETFLQCNLHLVDIRSADNVIADALSRKDDATALQHILRWRQANSPEVLVPGPIPGVPARAGGALLCFLSELRSCLVLGLPCRALVAAALALR